MQISELIVALEDAKARFGDRPVMLAAGGHLDEWPEEVSGIDPAAAGGAHGSSFKVTEAGVVLT